jgi:hypothetical protein
VDPATLIPSTTSTYTSHPPGTLPDPTPTQQLTPTIDQTPITAPPPIAPIATTPSVPAQPPSPNPPAPLQTPALAPLEPMSPVTAAPPTPQASTSYVPSSDDKPPRRGTGKLVFAIIGFFFLMLIGSGVGLAYMVAYQDFSLGQAKLERQLSHAVQLLPFTPKTPAFLLERNVLAHKDNTRERFKLSIAAQSDDLLSSLGSDKLDMEVAGGIDYTDVNNILLDIEASITKDFQFSVRKPNALVYFKVTKVPELITTALGLDYDTFVKPFIDQWVSYDTTTLETDAREILNQERTDEAIKPTDLEDLINSNAYTAFLKNSTVESAELPDGTKAYKITTDFPPELIDYLFEEATKDTADTLDYDRYLYESNFTKVSDMFQKATTDIWIEENTYLLRKFNMSMVISPPSETGEVELFEVSSPIRIVVSYSGEKYGEPIEVPVPTDSITVEELVLRFQEVFMSGYSSQPMYDPGMSYDPSTYPETYDQDQILREQQSSQGQPGQLQYSQPGMLSVDQVLGAFRQYNEAEMK